MITYSVYERNNNLQLYSRFHQGIKEERQRITMEEMGIPAKRMFVDMQSGKDSVCLAYRIAENCRLRMFLSVKVLIV